MNNEDYYDDDEDEGLDEDPSEVVSCPECGAEVYEDVDRCPVCENYIVHDTSAWSGRPMWWVVLGGLGVIATIAALAFGSLAF